MLFTALTKGNQAIDCQHERIWDNFINAVRPVKRDL